MTTFVPLAPDADGTASAVAVGEWILQIIRLYDDSPDSIKAKEYHQQFLSQFNRAEQPSGGTHMPHTENLIRLLLSQHALVFRWLNDVKNDTVPGSGNETRRTYGEALREVEDFFLLLTSMIVLRIPSPQDSGAAVGQVCEVLLGEADFPEFRLKLLMSLYNAFPPTFPYRFPIFVAVLEYAAKMELFHHILPYIKYIESWMPDWNMLPSAKRHVFLILANELKKLGKCEEAYSFLKKHVMYFQNEKETVLADEVTVAAALELCEDSLRLNEVFYYDSILELDAIQHLRKTSHSLMVDLIEIFCSKGPKEFDELTKNHPNLLKDHGLEHDSCRRKICVLWLATILNKKTEVQLNHLAPLLGMQVMEIESLLVYGIGENILDAKIDQKSGTVYVRNTIQREFTKTNWEEVYVAIEHWNTSIKHILTALGNAHKTSHPIQHPTAVNSGSS